MADVADEQSCLALLGDRRTTGANVTDDCEGCGLQGGMVRLEKAMWYGMDGTILIKIKINVQC